MKYEISDFGRAFRVMPPLDPFALAIFIIPYTPVDPAQSA